MTKIKNMAPCDPDKQATQDQSQKPADVDSLAGAFEVVSLGDIFTPANSKAVSTIDDNESSKIKVETPEKASNIHSPLRLRGSPTAGDDKTKDDTVGDGKPVHVKVEKSKCVYTEIEKNKPVYTKAENNKPIPSSPPYYTPPTSPSGARLARKICRSCQTPAVKCITSIFNENGNAGRPYWACPNRQCEATKKSDFEKGWVSWGDSKGIDDKNPTCFCDVPSRQDRICKDGGKKGLGFWTCAEGECDYYSEDLFGVFNAEVTRYFWPWLV
ncbi:hypothetical protein CLAFUW4_14112 [Fulvia fulva]|uniref:GRF-like zinc ribbon domain-containing protein n=1 Tax=Passalora fulva TaxID=5499 RepID=A0A9Q8UW24_PASFU|nr:uncharacterized protein CLAFUR5_13947 [Fulvia fulva]KAK4610346.1 hypothetical protein CLAFUR4_14115 [Fulvia fulva]KAK4611290.1 hypothetical protein CLAFUR0_14119 [Fulvia fulva]UJO24462.1 hypothetical protein CLAFUR5_13947 [Fulvia fulva]WPV21869.1 hypothetical protein CLAFUW4_14112 [Fulvia fulva]WPV37350.1 hypothetical protein CLAFUW7_14123 [Fulvia fulva]